MRARVESAQAHDGLDQLGLAVALDAGDADDLAPADRRSETSSRIGPAVGSATREAVDRQLDLVGDGGLAGLGRRELAAHHQLGQLRGR